MNELVIANVNANVGEALSFLVKEQQVALSELAAIYEMRALVLVAGASRNSYAGQLVAVLHEATAIKTS